MFFYSDQREPFSGSIDFSKIDATKKYLEHYSNLLLLKVMMTEGSVHEKAQARKETTICERKMEFWKRQERFDMKEAIKGCDELKKQWGGRA